jgi:hypothetical protein
MKAQEFIFEEDTLAEFKRAFKRTKSGKTKLRFRCPSGPRKGRVVSKPSDCFKAPDPAKASKMRLTRRRTGIRQARKARRTKQINPFSKLVKQLNKRMS